MFFIQGPDEISQVVYVLQYLFQVREWDDFVIWFKWIGTPYKIAASIIIFGCFYIIWMFLKAAIIDNDE